MIFKIRTDIISITSFPGSKQGQRFHAAKLKQIENIEEFPN